MTAAATPAAEADEQNRHTVLGDFRESVHDVWAHRELLWQLARRDIVLRYKQSVMGFGWALLMPILLVSAGLVVRFVMAYMSGQPATLDDMGGVVVKSLPWAFFIGAVSFSSSTLIGNASLVSKVFFPREVLPLAAVITQGVDTLIASAAIVLVLPFAGAALTPALLWVLPLTGLLLLLTSAICLFLACANLFFRDVKYLVQIFLTFGIFFTPVLFDIPMLGERLGPLMLLNPVAPILEGFRLTVIEGHNLLEPLRVIEDGGKVAELWIPGALFAAVGVTVIGFFLSVAMFRRLQYLFAEYV